MRLSANTRVIFEVRPSAWVRGFALRYGTLRLPPLRRPALRSSAFLLAGVPPSALRSSLPGAWSGLPCRRPLSVLPGSPFPASGPLLWQLRDSGASHPTLFCTRALPTAAVRSPTIRLAAVRTPVFGNPIIRSAVSCLWCCGPDSRSSTGVRTADKKAPRRTRTGVRRGCTRHLAHYATGAVRMLRFVTVQRGVPWETRHIWCVPLHSGVRRGAAFGPWPGPVRSSAERAVFARFVRRAARRAPLSRAGPCRVAR